MDLRHPQLPQLAVPDLLSHALSLQGGGGSSEGTQPVGETPAAPGLLTDTDVTAGGGAEVAGTAEEAEEEPEQHGSSQGASKGGAAKSPSRKKATAAAAGTTGSAAKVSDRWCSTFIGIKCS